MYLPASNLMYINVYVCYVCMTTTVERLISYFMKSYLPISTQHFRLSWIVKLSEMYLQNVIVCMG